MTDLDFMKLALAQAQAAAAEDEVPVGAVLVKEGRVIAAAHNETQRRGDATAHAELLALQRGMALLGPRLTGCTLYVTLEPCAMCAGAAVNAKLTRLIFGAMDARAGCMGSVTDLCSGLGFSVACAGGLLAEDCAALLTDYFRGKR